MKQKEDNKNRKKMNTLELLYNKALMKAAGEADEHVKKTKIWGFSQSSIVENVIELFL